MIAETAALLKNDSRFDSLKGLDPNSAGYKNLVVSIALEKGFNDKDREPLLKKQKELDAKKTALENKMKTMFQTDKNNKLILVNGEPVLDQTKMNKAIADELKSRQAEMQKRIDNLKIVAMADKKIRELQAIKNPDDSQKSELKFWTDMKNQYDFSPSNVPAEVLKQRFMEEKVKVIDAMKSFPDVKIGTDYKLSGSKNDIEKVLSKLEKDLPNNPHVAKLMAMNTYETIPDPKFGNVFQVTVYGQKILLLNNPKNDWNNPDKIGNSNAQVWLNTANAIKESGLDTVVISAVNYGGGATHGKGEALDILYVRQGGKDILIDKGENYETSYPEYPDALRAFDNAMIRQPGSVHIWNPWIMYYSGNTAPANKAIEWMKSPHWPEIQKLLALGEKGNGLLNQYFIDNAPELKPSETDLPIHQDWGHTTHEHVNTNPIYDDMRYF